MNGGLQGTAQSVDTVEQQAAPFHTGCGLPGTSGESRARLDIVGEGCPSRKGPRQAAWLSCSCFSEDNLLASGSCQSLSRKSLLMLMPDFGLACPTALLQSRWTELLPDTGISREHGRVALFLDSQ